jgi:hypothetical protein
VLYIIGTAILIIVAGAYWSRRYGTGQDPTVTVAGFNRALAAMEPSEPRYRPTPRAGAPGGTGGEGRDGRRWD